MSTPVKVTETTSVEVRPERPDNWRTLLLVGAVIAVAIIIAAYALTGPRWGTFCLVLALYEGWTLINQYREDTISEAVWILARRPLTGLLFGVAVGWGAGSGYLGDPVVVGRAFAIGMVFGHFFWQQFATPVQTTHTESGEVHAKG